MKNYQICNYNFAIALDGLGQLGTISISKKGELNVSPGITKALSDDEITEMSNRALMAYSILKTGKVTNSLFDFKITKGLDRYAVKQVMLGKEIFIGCILYKDKRLIFQDDVPEYIRNLCIKKLNDKHLTDFYYHGAHYDGD